MNDEGERRIVINIPKPRACSKEPDYSTKIVRKIPDKKIRKPSEVSLSKYTLHGTGPVPIQTIKKDELLLSYKVYAKKQERKNHELRLAINIYDKYKIAHTDFRSRLHVDDSEDNIYAVTNIDKGFYKCVEAHKLSTYAPPFKSLKNLFNQYIRLKQKIGYINDYTLNIEVLQRKEEEIYNRSFESYMEQAKYLDEFISADYKKSIACLDECDKLAYEVHKTETELQHLATEKFTIVSRLIGLDYLYGLQQKYGRFLYYLSPPSWRLKHRDFARSIEIEAKGFDFNCSSEEDTFKVIFEKMKNECYSGLIKPAIYFQNPSDLIDIFDRFERQQLYHFSHVIRVEPLIKDLRKNINVLKGKLGKETAVILNIIKHFDNKLQFYNDRCSDLEEKFLKILHGTFHETVAAPGVLKLKLHLEFNYERVYSEKLWKMDIMTTAKELEKMYMDFSKKLDDIHNDKVILAVAQYMDMVNKKNKRAKVAARELLLFRRLQRDLLRTHAFVDRELAVETKQKANKTSLRKQSVHHVSKAQVDEGKLKVLTDTEREYLTLFTDWTENNDPADYLQSFSIARE